MQQPLKDASAFYEVERRARHAERPGFRINELQISPEQNVAIAYGHASTPANSLITARLKAENTKPTTSHRNTRGVKKFESFTLPNEYSAPKICN